MSTREEEFAIDLHELSKLPEFNSVSFETIIDKIRAHAAEVTSKLSLSFTAHSHIISF